jgi:CubicO group peptidase (beta-lactamase class C family)
MKLRSRLAAALGVAALSLPALAQPTGPAVPAAKPTAAVQVPATVPSVDATPGTPQLTRADVEAWLDGYMPFSIQKSDIAGAVVVVVKDGQVLLQKGYGYADVAKKIPVDPETTLFRPGSVSKLLTWTAVMQQVERGKLNLDTDVNTYIDFKIPAWNGKPITLRNIMTHTAGFEEAGKEIMSPDPKGATELSVLLKKWTPTRVYAPGEVPAYSNYATALAGYIVTRVSGEKTFDDYVEKNVLIPLGMTHSSFRQPLPAQLQPMMSKGYMLGSGEPKPYEMVGPAPAGSLASSGADMAKFMIAHLQNGTYNGVQILKPETAQEMHTTALTIAPKVHRMLLGFYEIDRNGHRVFGHGGDTQWFHTYLQLFPDDNVGLYVSVNSRGAGGDLRTGLFNGFTDRYFPGEPITTTVDAKTAAEHAKMIEGRYWNSRRSSTNLPAFGNLLSQTKVVINADGTISAGFKDPGGAVTKWREVEPFVWQAVGGKERLAAQVKDGKVVQWSFDAVSPFMWWSKVPTSASGAWLLPALFGSLAALLLTVLLWPVAMVARRKYGHSFALTGTSAKTYRLVRLAAIVALVAVGFAGYTILVTMSDLANMMPSHDGQFWAVHILTLVAFVGGTLIALWNLFVVWTGGRSWFAKLWSLVLALSFLALLYIGFAFKLIAFNVNF